MSRYLTTALAATVHGTFFIRKNRRLTKRVTRRIALGGSERVLFYGALLFVAGTTWLRYKCYCLVCSVNLGKNMHRLGTAAFRYAGRTSSNFDIAGPSNPTDCIRVDRVRHSESGGGVRISSGTTKPSTLRKVGGAIAPLHETTAN